MKRLKIYCKAYLKQHVGAHVFSLPPVDSHIAGVKADEIVMNVTLRDTEDIDLLEDFLKQIRPCFGPTRSPKKD